MDNNCTIYRTVDFIGKRWTLLILLELYKGKIRRYSEIKGRMADITPKMLSARLKELEKEGLVHKSIDSSEFPVKCEYKLTPKGNDFIKIIKDIKMWALKWNIKNRLCEGIDCKQCRL